MQVFYGTSASSREVLPAPRPPAPAPHRGRDDPAARPHAQRVQRADEQGTFRGTEQFFESAPLMGLFLSKIEF